MGSAEEVCCIPPVTTPPLNGEGEEEGINVLI